MSGSGRSPTREGAVRIIPELEALDALAPEIREAAGHLSKDWPQIFTEDELTARLSSELIDMEGADDLSQVEPRSSRMILLLSIGKRVIEREIRDYEYHSGDLVTPVKHDRKKAE